MSIRFGPFEIDPECLELRRDGVTIPLQPLPVRILARLAGEPGSFVARDELAALGWPDTPWVAEQALNTCIYQIRRALSASGPSPVELQTLRGRGYRLNVSEGVTAAGPGRARRRRAVGIGLVVAGVALAGVYATGIGSDLPIPPEARQALSRARYLATETQDLATARAVLDSARLRYPGVAPVHAELAELSVRVGDLQAAEDAASRALELDPSSATGLRARALLSMLAGGWKAAEKDLNRAYESDPADVRTLTTLAFLRTVERRFDDADELIRRARLVDPVATSVYQDAGMLYLLMGRFADASRYCREVLELRRGSAWAADCLFDLSLLSGRLEDAARWGRRLLDAYGATGPPEDLPTEAVVGETSSWLVARWEQAVERGAHPFGLALAYATSGDDRRAMAALEAAAERPRLELLTIAVDPRFSALRGRPALRALTDRLRLPG